ncbi:hypothetical protein [Flavobacterium sp.]|uniref:hypothetical protein n=1 Tax=Flavobacterium sp. TaxID=239 RepID=UPI003753619D
MAKHILLFLIFLPMLSFSQNERLKILRAIIVSDSIQVERLSVVNVTAETFTITDDLGQFSIFAKEDDVLIISGVAFDSKEIILKNSDFKEMIFKIHVNIKVNQLDEVKIAPFKLSGDLVYDAKRIKLKPAFKVELPKLDVSKLEITGVSVRTVNMFEPKKMNGVDFIKVGGMVADLFKGSSNTFKPIPEKIITYEEFVTQTKVRFSTNFFKETLKLDEDQINLFLTYSFSNEIQAKKLLDPSNGLAFMEFMIAKSEEFHKKN